MPFVIDQGEPMPHPKWLTELGKSLSDDQQALLSTNLRAALAKATVQSTDNEHTLGIAREIAVVALTELTPVALASNESGSNLKVLVAHIERWQRTKRTTPANTYLVQALRAEAAHHQTKPTGQALRAAARLICWTHSVNYKNPRSRTPSFRVGTMPMITSDFLTVCLAAGAYDYVCAERGINTVVDVLNELF